MEDKKYKIKATFYEGHLKYNIVNENGRPVIGNLSLEQATYYIDNPDALKSQLRAFKITGICILIFIISSGIYFYYNS